MDFGPETAPFSSIMNRELFLIWDYGLMTSPMTSMLASAHPTQPNPTPPPTSTTSRLCNLLSATSFPGLPPTRPCRAKREAC